MSESEVNQDTAIDIATLQHIGSIEVQENSAAEGGENESMVSDAELRRMFAGALGTASYGLTQVFMPNWKVTHEENLMMGNSVADMVDYYFPDAKTLGGPIGGVVAAGLTIAAPRLEKGVPMKLPPPDKSAEKPRNEKQPISGGDGLDDLRSMQMEGE